MAIYTQRNEGKFHIAPTANHLAVCINVVDIGKQEVEYEGKKSIVNKVIVEWEIDERIVSDDDYNGKRFTISKEYTNSLGEKSALFKDITSWRGKPFTSEELKKFDLEKLIGANCLLNVLQYETKNKRLRSKVISISPLPKNSDRLTPEHDRTISKWIQEKIDNQIGGEKKVVSNYDSMVEEQETEEVQF